MAYCSGSTAKATGESSMPKRGGRRSTPKTILYASTQAAAGFLLGSLVFSLASDWLFNRDSRINMENDVKGLKMWQVRHGLEVQQVLLRLRGLETSAAELRVMSRLKGIDPSGK